MDKKDHIPMPTPMERRAAIRRIAEEGLADTAPSWRSLPLSALVFGVEDCLFMAVLLGLLPLALLPLPAGLLAEKLSLTLFLSAPLLYAAAHLLTMWKESQCGTLDWKRTCRLSLQTLTALRMGLFGGAAVLVSVPVDLLLWHFSGRVMPLGRILAVSFSSLFLHAALSLVCRDGRRGWAVTLALWVLLDVLLTVWEERVHFLMKVPTAIFCLLAGACLAAALYQMYTVLRQPQKGGVLYAQR